MGGEIYLIIIIIPTMLSILLILANKKKNLYRNSFYDLAEKFATYEDIEDINVYKSKIKEDLKEHIYKMEVKFS